MTEQEYRELLKAIADVRAKRAGTPAAARQLLKDEGVLDESGEIAEPYAATDEEPSLFSGE